MTTRAPFLSQRYGAYYHREVPEPDEETDQRRPRNTPCGDYLRRFWHPVIESDALTDLPKSIKVLGEELVASGMAAATLACWNCTAPTGAPPWSMARLRATEYAAAITAGSLVSTGRFSIRRANRRKAPSKRDCATARTLLSNTKAWSSPTWARRSCALLSHVRHLQGRARLLPRQAGKRVLALQLASGQGQLHGPSPYCLPPYH